MENGKGERGMDTVIELSRLAGEDSGLVQCFDHGLWVPLGLDDGS